MKKENIVDKIIKDIEEGKYSLEPNKENRAFIEELRLKMEPHVKALQKDFDQKRLQYKRQKSILISAIIALTITVCLGAVYLIVNSPEATLYTKGNQVSNLVIGEIEVDANGSTKLEYSRDTSLAIKKLKLKEGEIFVESPAAYVEIIIKDKIITVSNGSVNIFSRDNYDKISVVKGSVSISSNTSSKVLSAGEEERIKDGLSTTRPIGNLDGPGSYRKGFLYIEDEPISYLIKETQRLYQIEIIADESLLNDTRPINGFYEISSDVLDILAQSIPKEYLIKKVDDKTIRISKEEKIRLER